MPAPKGNKYALRNKGGRPSKFGADTLDFTQAYIKQAVDETKTGKNGKKTVRVNLPSIEGLARWLKVSTDTIYKWGKENEEFFGMLGELKAIQAERLINNSLAGTYSPVIAKLLLSSKHGYSERNQTDIEIKRPIPILGGLSKSDDPGNKKPFHRIF